MRSLRLQALCFLVKLQLLLLFQEGIEALLILVLMHLAPDKLDTRDAPQECGQSLRFARFTLSANCPRFIQIR